MLRCTLSIGKCVILTSEGGPPEVEYALFDPGNIELSASQPGAIREVGYRTTAGEARARLEQAGVTLNLALDAAAQMKPALAALYARGPTAQRMAQQLGPCELFDGRTYDANRRRYAGAWLDLDALAQDLNVLRAPTALQALFLVSVLSETASDVDVHLTTSEWTAERRPGERTFRRVPLDHVVDLPRALHQLSVDPPKRPAERGLGGLTRSGLLDAVRERAAHSATPQVRERLAELEKSLRQRDPPTDGPLADPELWALEMQLARGETQGIREKVEALARARGEEPAVAYLRARMDLALGTEGPRQVAERVSTLVEGNRSFSELTLLAAQAWALAGDVRRAKGFARDLVEDRDAPDDLRIAALELLDAASNPSHPPARTESEPAKASDPVDASPDTDQEKEGGGAAVAANAEKESRRSSGRVKTAPPVEATVAADAPAASDEPVPDTVIDPAPVMTVERKSTVPLAPEASPERGRAGGAMLTTQRIMRPPAPPFPSTSPRRSSPPPPPDRSGEVVDAVAIPVEPSERPSQVPPAAERGIALHTERIPQFAHPPRGASRPPYRTDLPAPLPAPYARFPLTPPPPRDVNAPAELAEHLSLPPGLHGQPPPRDNLPRTVLDARLAFTHFSRELGREYRTRYGVELRTDVPSLEQMQRRLREAFPDGEIRTPEELFDVRRHGAFLSEMIARQLGGWWVDIGPSELGYWAMMVPPSTRIWPFGRVLRFVIGSKDGKDERDLVGYYTELENRVRR